MWSKMASQEKKNNDIFVRIQNVTIRALFSTTAIKVAERKLKDKFPKWPLTAVVSEIRLEFSI
jgi:hypothetical protein